MHPDLTIAAQTAPGDGICLKGSGLSIEASNVIVRGLRSRVGDGEVGTSGQNRRSLQIIGPVSDVIVDHCSFGWGVDDDLTVYADKLSRYVDIIRHNDAELASNGQLRLHKVSLSVFAVAL